MRQICGPKLIIDAPTPEELDWIFESLQSPPIHLPLSMIKGPTREEFDNGELHLVEACGRGTEMVRYFIARYRDSGQPWGFFLEYGWGGTFDTIREFDLAVTEDGQGSLGLLLEAHIIGAQFLFVNRLAKRLRWRVKAPEDSPPLWYGRLAARRIGGVVEPHPVTDEPLSKHIFELTHREFSELFERHGLDENEDYGNQAKPLWELLR